MQTFARGKGKRRKNKTSFFFFRGKKITDGHRKKQKRKAVTLPEQNIYSKFKLFKFDKNENIYI